VNMRSIAFGLLVLTTVAAGSARTPSLLQSTPPNIPLPSNLIPIPQYVQEVDYSCGPSSALALLRYWDYATYWNATEQSLYGPMNTTEAEGTDPQPIANYFVNFAQIPAVYVWGNATVTLDRLKQAIDDGEPPIVDLQAWRLNDSVVWSTDWDDGHYNVLIGYDDSNLFFMDPSTDGNYAYIPITEFLTRWHDTLATNQKVWSMLILVSGTANPHPVPPSIPIASYED